MVKRRKKNWSGKIRELKKPRIMQYGFIVENMPHDEVLRWCNNAFESKPGGYNWMYRNRSFAKYRGMAFYFSDEIDAMAFKLRWI